MLFLLLAGLAAAEPAVTTQPPCDRPLTQTRGAAPDGTQKLGELPPGRAMLAVDLSIRGCPMAVLMQRDASGRRVVTPLERAGKVLVPTHRSSDRGSDRGSDRASERQRRLERD